MDKVDQQYLDELVKAQGEDVPTSAYDMKYEEDGNTIDSIIEMAKGIGKGDEVVDNKVVLVYIKVCFIDKCPLRPMNTEFCHSIRLNKSPTV